MKIPFGFALGFAAGAYTFSKLTEQQRRGIADRVGSFASSGRTGRIADTVRRGVGDVADVATDRVTDVTEQATGAAAAALSADDAPDPAVTR